MRQNRLTENLKQSGQLRRGFTLVEVLVVLLIAAIVFSILATVLGSSFEILRTGENRAQLNSNARIALNYVSEDINTASYIPLAFDRDLNGFPDEDINNGYNLNAIWRVAFYDANNVPRVVSSYFMSEAWSDRIQTVHSSRAIVGGLQVFNSSFTVPKVLRQGGTNRATEYRSLFRLAVPANTDMPYYLAMEWDRNGDGIVDPQNTGLIGGVIQGYPEQVVVGPHQETAALIQDLFYQIRDDDLPQRARQIPIASNITRVKYEYLHEVPVYLSRADGANIEIAYQNNNDGTIIWVDSDYERSGNTADCEPLISHWELRPIDVAFNSNATDPVTGAEYAGTGYSLADQYPEGLNAGKLDGSHVNPPTGIGLGTNNGGPTGWNCADYYNVDNDGDDIADNAPVDRFAYVTTSVSNGQVIDGGIAQLRPDMEAIHGGAYYNYSVSPLNSGDFGDADGIPDGDGVADDPVPGWWLPFLRAVRVTVIATPRATIEERISRSGKAGSTGVTLFYRLDSPVPFADANRSQPLYNLTKDYIGSGKDMIVTRTVPVDYAYRANLVVDPHSAELSQGFSNIRRAELNYFNGARRILTDPLDPDAQISANTPVLKLLEKDPQ